MWTFNKNQIVASSVTSRADALAVGTQKAIDLIQVRASQQKIIGINTFERTRLNIEMTGLKLHCCGAKGD
jgi:hypothetical protein